MKVHIPKYSGFCPGVKFAEKSLQTLRGKDRNRDISVLGQLIHNSDYIERLRSEGIRTAKDIADIENGTVAVIRTHGVAREVEEKLRGRLEVVDLTCNKVKVLQRYISDHAAQNYFIIITGKRDHPETVGLVSYAKDALVIENETDLDRFVADYKSLLSPVIRKGYCRVLVLSQTTGNRALFEKVGGVVSETCRNECEVKVYDSTCSITSLREEEALDLQKNCDVTFVVGDRISSNANKLFEILQASGAETHFVENLADLRSRGLELSRYRDALVVSSSSTPDFVEREIVDYLLSI